jgi:hypothetical protein
MMVPAFFMSPFADGSEQVGNLEEFDLGDAGDAFDHLGRVARIMPLEQLEDRAWVLEP